MNPYNTENVIILRSVFGKVNNKYYINPCKDPKTGLFPSCVRRVDSHGDMILSDADRNSEEPLIPEDRVFIIEDGTTFDLSIPQAAAEWAAIEHCKLISASRNAKDKFGVNVIDGEDTTKVRNYKTAFNSRYGTAELYVERPGEDTKRRVNKKQTIHNARAFVFDDDLEGLLIKVKLLGRDMRHQPLADVQDFLLEIAEKNPERIINLYSGDDMNLRILFMEALENRVIVNKNNVFTYADSVILGASEQAVLSWMKDAKNLKVLELIRKDVHPELYSIENPDAIKALKAVEDTKTAGAKSKGSN